MRILLRCWQGCFYLPGYGPHPGTKLIIIVIAMGACAGMQDAGWIGAAVGAVFMALVYVPFYLIGSYNRAKAFYKEEAK